MSFNHSDIGYCILQQTGAHSYKLLLSYSSHADAIKYLIDHKLTIAYQRDYSEHGLIQWIV